MKNPMISFFQILLVAGLMILGAPSLSAQNISAQSVEQAQKEKPQAKDTTVEKAEQQTKIVKNKERKHKRKYVARKKGNRHGTIKGDHRRTKANGKNKADQHNGNCGPGGEDKPKENKSRVNEHGTKKAPVQNNKSIKQ